MKLDKRKTSIVVLALFSLILVTMGTSYAFFTYAKDANGNIITTGTVSFYYTENANVGNGIYLQTQNTYDDDQGKLLNNTENVFNFKVGGDTTGNSAVNYEITVEQYIKDGEEEYTLPESAIKVYLTETSDLTTEIESPLTVDGINVKSYKNLIETTESNLTGKTIYKGTVPKGISGYTKNFKLRSWISNDIDLTNSNYLNKTFILKVTVKAI